jgi:hypothetical protein
MPAPPATLVKIVPSRPLFAVILILGMAFHSPASAQDTLDKVRSFDLNSYAPGAFVHSSSSLYEGVDDFLIVYPAPFLLNNELQESYLRSWYSSFVVKCNI